ncbi:MAG: Hsp20/alpha crystallin family protein [Acidobacteriota bacterium]|nr:Hsp20/alpha crystallin family protein [Acidobacteriota bacterium]
MKQKLQSAQLEVARIQSEINRLFETLLRLRDGGASVGAWSPAVDVAETAEELRVEVELPGVEPSSLKVSARGGRLLVQGDRPSSQLRKIPGAHVLHDEREYGPFEVEIPLATAVNTHRAKADLARGVLRIQLPKVPNRRGEAVSIAIDTGKR